MKKCLFIASLILLASACSTNAPMGSQDAPAKDNKVDSFFPVTSFIKGQLRQIDSLTINPLHTVRINQQTDSFWIKPSALSPLLADFTQPEIKETNLTTLFKGSSFNDQTLNSVTFTYDPISALPNSISLRHWDLYIDPESGKVRKVYLVKQNKKQDGTYIQQLTWKTDQWAMITTLLEKTDGSTSLLKEEKFVWNFKE